MLALARSAPPFAPSATYDPDGDCIEFIAKPDSFYAERIDDLVTVYYSQQSREIVGSLIKSMSRFNRDVLQKVPGFRIEIDDGKVRLVQLFRAKLWTSGFDPENVVSITYRKLLKVAEDSNLDIEFAIA
jgi:hypothetical protein